MKEIKRHLQGEMGSGLSFSLFSAVYVVISFVGQTILKSLTDDLFLTTAIGGLFSIISLIALLVFFAISRKEKFVLTVGVKWFNPIYLIPAILLVGGMFFGLGFVNYLLNDFLTGLGLKIPSTVIQMTGVWEYLVYVLVLAVCPAVFEEFYFRGLMLNGISSGDTKAKDIVIPSLVVALCFSVYHGSIVQLIYQFVFGFALAVLALKSGSVIPSVIAHFINNFLVLTFTYLNVNINLYGALEISLGLLALACYALFMIFYNKKSSKPDDDKVRRRSVKTFFAYALVGLVVCLTLIVGNFFA